MAKRVSICPLGHVHQNVLRCIKGCIEERCGISCEISAEMETPAYAYDERRCQYNSKQIIKNLIKSYPHDTDLLVGVTEVDLFVPILKYVFGLAQMEGNFSIISTHRLRPQFYKQPSDIELFNSRIKKTALHELGHCLGLTHCRIKRCVMYSSTKIEDTDFKHGDFCHSCYELFRWLFEKNDN